MCWFIGNRLALVETNARLVFYFSVGLSHEECEPRKHLCFTVSVMDLVPL